MDFAWLKANGWTIPGNLAYRHILHEWIKGGVPSQERIMQIIMQHEAENQTHKIIEALKEAVALKKDLDQLFQQVQNGEDNRHSS